MISCSRLHLLSKVSNGAKKGKRRDKSTTLYLLIFLWVLKSSYNNLRYLIHNLVCSQSSSREKIPRE
jgi:hypothetical protein